MLTQVILAEKRKISEYKKYISEALYNDILKLAGEARGLRVAIVNATSEGGGVAEILRGLAPLLNGLGVRVSWHVLNADAKFFNITKKIHNALQGGLELLAREEKQYYLDKNKIFAEDFYKLGTIDALIINDPQPLAAIEYFKGFCPAALHIHIDLSGPQKDAWNFFKPYVKRYDKIIFSLKEFAKNDLPAKKLVIFPPAIDPLADKNRPMELAAAKNILSEFSVNIDKPIMTQVSRFDPWKDPMGVIKTYYEIKNKIPGLQLILAGFQLAQDDPEAADVFKKVKKHAQGDPDIFLFSDPRVLKNISNDLFINAVQTGSDVIIQKSIKEGFGLVVTEAMWKGKAVVAGDVGGIKIQIKKGKNGFLASSSEQAAKKAIQLLKDEKLRDKIGKAARQTVKNKFLLPRLVRDYLRIFRGLCLASPTEARRFAASKKLPVS